MADPFMEKAIRAKLEEFPDPHDYHVADEAIQWLVDEVLTALIAEAEERGKWVPCPGRCEGTGKILFTGKLRGCIVEDLRTCPTCHGDERGIRRGHQGALRFQAEAAALLREWSDTEGMRAANIVDAIDAHEKYGNRE